MARETTARREPQAAARPLVWAYVGVAALALAAFALRVWTVRQSLPYVDHPDEPNPVDYVVRMLRTGDPNQHFFQKPSLFVYTLLAALSLHFRLGLASGAYPPIDQLAVTTHIVTTIPEFFFWGRVLVALFGGLTVAAAYGVVTRAWGRRAALAGALLVALLPFHVRFSRYITTDVLSGLLVLLAFGASLTVLRTGRWRAYAVAGLFAGFAASTKYNAGIVALTLVAAHMLCWKGQWLRRVPRLLAGALAAVAGFFAGSPFLLLSWREGLNGLLYQWGAYNGGQGGYYGGSWNVRGYVEFLLYDGLRPVAALAVLAGVALLLRARPRVALVWLSYATPALLVHMAMQTHYMQNMLPLLVLCALPFSVAAEAAADALAPLAPRLRPALLPAVLALLLLPGAWETARLTAQQARGDTRVQLISWLNSNVSPGVRVAAELKPVPEAPEARWTDVPQLPQHDLAWYRRQGYAFLVTSSKRWRQLTMPPEYGSVLAGPPLAEFGSPDPDAMLGPHLLVYATGLSPADVPAPPAQPAQIGGARFLGALVGRTEPKSELEPVKGVAPTASFKGGETLALRTFWQVESPFDRDYFIFVHVLNAAGATVAQRDTPPWQGRFPTTSWGAGSIVVDVNDVPLPALPPGQYRVVVGMFDPASGAHPTGADSVEITTVVIEAP
jgi:4-amino-4-deoxy-L-arabinose transferase-like glycosyltransferase